MPTSRISGATTPHPECLHGVNRENYTFCCKTSNREKNAKLKEAKIKCALNDIRGISTTNAINRYACKTGSNSRSWKDAHLMKRIQKNQWRNVTPTKPAGSNYDHILPSSDRKTENDLEEK